MKKQVLLGAFLLGSLLTMNAQEVNSFEAEEGYVLGNVHNQDGWTTTPVTGGEITNIQNQIVTDEAAKDGVWSIKLQKETGFGGQQDVIAGVFKNVTPVNPDLFTVSFDIFINQQSANDSDFAINLNNVTGTGAEMTRNMVNRLQFRFNGEIAAINNGTNAQGQPALIFEATTATWTPQTWNNVRIVVDFQNEVTTYFVNGVEVGTSDVLSTAINEVAFLHDNFAGFAYLDKVAFDSAPTMGTNQVASSQFSVYPNPANNVINIANAENVLVTGVAIVDINGRTVKTAKFDNVSEAQINISDLSSGMYLMNISSANGMVTKKIVKN